MPTTLDDILRNTRATIPALRLRLAALEREAATAPLPPSFIEGLTGRGLAVVAEVKRRSPSAGNIAAGLDPVRHALAYAGAGAAAVSVLTDQRHFGGSLEDLHAVSRAVSLPTLRKDFILDESQIAEARAAGAAAVLLIVRALAPDRLRQLMAYSASLGLAALVEVHDGGELGVALEAGARVIGVNSRNLDTFAIDTVAAWALLSRIPAGCVAVAESGISTVEDARRAAEAGADAVLVGTALSASAEPGILIRAASGVVRTGR